MKDSTIIVIGILGIVGAIGLALLLKKQPTGIPVNPVPIEVIAEPVPINPPPRGGQNPT